MKLCTDKTHPDELFLSPWLRSLPYTPRAQERPDLSCKLCQPLSAGPHICAKCVHRRSVQSRKYKWVNVMTVSWGTSPLPYDDLLYSRINYFSRIWSGFKPKPPRWEEDTSIRPKAALWLTVFRNLNPSLRSLQSDDNQKRFLVFMLAVWCIYWGHFLKPISGTINYTTPQV